LRRFLPVCVWRMDEEQPYPAPAYFVTIRVPADPSPGSPARAGSPPFPPRGRGDRQELFTMRPKSRVGASPAHNDSQEWPQTECIRPKPEELLVRDVWVTMLPAVTIRPFDCTAIPGAARAASWPEVPKVVSRLPLLLYRASAPEGSPPNVTRYLPLDSNAIALPPNTNAAVPSVAIRLASVLAVSAMVQCGI